MLTKSVLTFNHEQAPPERELPTWLTPEKLAACIDELVPLLLRCEQRLRQQQLPNFDSLSLEEKRIALTSSGFFASWERESQEVVAAALAQHSITLEVFECAMYRYMHEPVVWDAKEKKDVMIARAPVFLAMAATLEPSS